MSRNILDKLYDYGLFHLTEIEDTDGAYRAALDSLVKAEAELKKVYPDSSDILDKYQSADIELHNLSNRNEFRKGFKVGAQLVLEMIKPIK
ncbi:MAG: myb domain-containing protein [Ruminococcus sp.]|nr:myb domain-containing protein [Ruminococcus sp.]